MRRLSPTRRAALKARKRELRQRLRARRRPDLRRKRRRTAAIIAVIAIILLLLLLRDCGPEEPAAVGQPLPAAPAEPTEPPVEEEATPSPRPLRGHIPRRDRPAYEGASPDALPWLAAFRLQVSARSPRLAACFVGTDGPGRLKWTTTVQPTQGAVSDHALEPVLDSPELTLDQRACVLEALEDPRYHLREAEPARVSLIIEF